MENAKMFNPHVSVDCVLMTIVNDKLSVLLVERKDQHGHALGLKLPGGLIYQTEDLDEAANRTLNDATGMKRVQLHQFRCFGSPMRTKNKEDVIWLESASNQKIMQAYQGSIRIITVAYLALCKPDKKTADSEYESKHWVAIDSLPRMPFDHNEIVNEAVKEIRLWIDREPAIVFNYLKKKFTASELRRTYEILYNKTLDVRNFHKKMKSWEYLLPTEDRKEGTAHRSPRYYRFDKIIYNKQRAKLNKNLE
ncbi:8-oxo-dGTP diphosphatase [Parabacteroides sp. PFB2-12]|uniref:NrtR DNA-binding winged helix domain-containing protein n=1 Tax=unclassified Parabacteroides TaxID=2649774 RepID=UPI0024748EF7|nr:MULTISPECIES: NUDIX domain-containing protein [unclassified Parabacteroides]MDH6343715.1 8-oxo-dGTP diphosphatase [Parabacteroides sp. PM6-13]MDH6391351.1 8-oxo-dGTP diphosphatase [Parabacteroides sp. PFB2-12]